MLLRDMMTARIEDIPSDATLMQAAEKMKRLDIGAIPVRENNRLIGMITDRDITVRAVAEGRDPKKVPVREAMSRDICFCYEDDTVESAAKLMEDKQIRRLAVFDRSERAGVGVSVGTSVGHAPRRPGTFGSIRTEFPQFARAGQTESIVVAVPSFSGFVDQVKEIEFQRSPCLCSYSASSTARPVWELSTAA